MRTAVSGLASLGISISLALMLSGCGGGQDTGSAGADERAQAQEQAEQAAEQEAQERVDTPDTAQAPAEQAPPGGPTPLTPEQEASMVTTPSGLKYIDIVEGTGASPSPGQTVSVHYTGWFLDGRKFDSSVDRGQPFNFILGQKQVIAGWDEGVASMKIGGKRKLMVPSKLAYGERGHPAGIPPNTDLTFEVELLGIR